MGQRHVAPRHRRGELTLTIPQQAKAGPWKPGPRRRASPTRKPPCTLHTAPRRRRPAVASPGSPGSTPGTSNTPLRIRGPFFLLFGLVGLFPLVYTFVVSLNNWNLLTGPVNGWGWPTTPAN
ncbi:sugar ABC transporter permease [Tessaracoccus coleopterorum]|uniref:sugar ABC transporter permease n=1 Tax=Tessaracoccus coleopterorum TaxID=2714950 RepID=UPI0018D4492C|nr:sugar ABC transporter permease [Tessaracoccus coleopterorum]